MRRGPALLLVLTAAAGPACQEPAPLGKPAPGDSGAPASLHWPYWPLSMRVHPLTRVVADPGSGERVIEARVEFDDPDGVSTRAVGRLSIDLWPAEGGAEPLNQWSIDLTEAATNTQRFDVVTRTYLLRLRPDAPLAGPRRLVVRYEGADGRVLSDRFTLE